MTLITRGVIQLRIFSDKDQSRLAELCNDVRIWNNVRDIFPNPYSEEDAVRFINSCKNEDPPLTFAIDYKGELAGCTGLVRQADVYRLSAELGYWIGEPYRGMGIATNAVKLIAEYGFEQLGLVRIYSGVFDFNTASRRVLEKAGFKLEGIFEKSTMKNGIICNEYRFAKVKNNL